MSLLSKNVASGNDLVVRFFVKCRYPIYYGYFFLEDYQFDDHHMHFSSNWKYARRIVVYKNYD